MNPHSQVATAGYEVPEQPSAPATMDEAQAILSDTISTLEATAELLEHKLASVLHMPRPEAAKAAEDWSGTGVPLADDLHRHAGRCRTVVGRLNDLNQRIAL